MTKSMRGSAIAAARCYGRDAHLIRLANWANFGGATHLQIRRPRVTGRHGGRRLQLARSVTGAGVKFNAWGINRFAMKRPFAAVIICLLRCTQATT